MTIYVSPEIELKIFKMKEANTLKQGLFNGLVGSDRNYADLYFELEGFSKFLQPPFELRPNWNYLGENTDVAPRHDCIPHLFSMEMLIKPITVNGWFDNDEFIPLIKLAEHAFAWNEAEHDHYILGSQVSSRTGLGFYFEDNCFKTTDVSFQNSFSQIELFEILDQWHFNRFHLDEDEFIEANKSKVYSPK